MEDHCSSPASSSCRSRWEDFVASLDDHDIDSSLHYRDVETAGPAVQSLEFPTPTIVSATLLPSMRVLDHRYNSSCQVANILIRTDRDDVDVAYALRKRFHQTPYGSIRTAVLLKRKSSRTFRGEQLEWASTDDIVAVKLSSWNKVRQFRGQGQQQQPLVEDPVREAAAMQLVGNYHPNVIGCYEVLQDSRNLYTIMPYVSRATNLHEKIFAEVPPHRTRTNNNNNNNNNNTGGNKNDPGRRRDHDPIPPRDEDEARYIFRQILRGILHLQQKGIFHGDISLDNILISSSNKVKIIDLGMSLRVPYSDPCCPGGITDVSEGETRLLMKTEGETGKPMYLAPELLTDNKAFDGFAADLWAAGVILFVLCVGLAPFKVAEHSEKRYAKISSGGLKRLMKNLNISVSAEACDLLQNMLWENPRERLSLLEVMKHPWVMGQQMTTMESKSIVPNGISSEESVGSVSSTEPTTKETKRDHENPLPSKPANFVSPNKPNTFKVPPETRESVSEPRNEVPTPVNSNRFKNKFQQIGPKLRSGAQHIGPKLKTNAQMIGPKFKHAIANAKRATATAGCKGTSSSPNDADAATNSSYIDGNDSTKTTPPRSNKSSPRTRRESAKLHLLNQLTTVMPNKPK